LVSLRGICINSRLEHQGEIVNSIRTNRRSHVRNVVCGFAGALLLQATLASNADTVHLVRNINTTLIPQSSYPAALGALGSRLLFGATDATGPGLWSTDGTAAGTKLLQRLTGLGILAGSPWNNFLTTGSHGYFVSADGSGTSSVWITDGTSAGTSRAISLPSGSSETASLLGLFNSMVVFSSRDPNDNGQMYVTDGTPAGTHRLTSFSGANEAGALYGFVVAGSKFYFVAMDTMYNRQIWVSDGTAAGTQQVTNGLTSAAVYNPQSFQLVGSLVLYESSGYLWSIDSTTDTIASVVTSSGTPGFGPPGVASTTLANMGGFVLFLGGSGFAPSDGLQLWRSDGTAAGTYEVAAATANPTSNEIQYPVFEQVGSNVVYIGDDGVNGPQLWGSDGTSAHTVRLTSAAANPQDPAQVAAPMMVIGNTAYLTISDGAAATTRSVWRTDGTAAGTERLGGLPSVSIGEAGVAPLSGDSSTVYIGIPDANASSMSLYKYLPASNSSTLVETSPVIYSGDEFFEMNGLLFFSPTEPVIGDEPWVSNGTAAGTHLIEEINPQVADSGSFPDEFVNFGGRLAFVADDGISGRELWISDGTSAGTKLLADINPGSASSNPNHLFAANGALYFFATDNSGHSKFMRLAAPGAVAEPLATLSPQPAVPFAACGEDGAVVIGTQMFFAADDGETGLELWTSDGTAAGTHLTADIAAGISGSDPCYLTVLAGKVYFSAQGALGNELWSSDGTASGTVQVVDIAPGAVSSNPSGLAVFNSALYFAADDTVHGSELWTSNGTAKGTSLIADLVPGSTGSYPYPIGTLNGRLLLQTYVTPTATSYVSQFWTTDGTTKGTTQVGTYTFPPVVNPLINGNLVFFAGQDAADVEPWVSDGTASGTHILKDINPNGSSNPSWFENFLGATLFEVTDPKLGEQLWRSDGTAGGTLLVSSIPALDPNPSNVTSARHRLTVGASFFISANDPIDGTELYTLTHAAPVAASDSATATDDAAATIDVLANDVAPDGTLNPASIVITTSPMHGTATVSSGKVIYTPTTGFAGTDTFAYTVSDNQGIASAPAIVTIKVTSPPPSSGGGGGGGGGGSIGWLTVFGLVSLWCGRSRRIVSQTVSWCQAPRERAAYPATRSRCGAHFWAIRMRGAASP
jgi:ELWxxDGT repeat protein